VIRPDHVTSGRDPLIAAPARPTTDSTRITTGTENTCARAHLLTYFPRRRFGSGTNPFILSAS